MMTLQEFLRESNKIEGIDKDVPQEHMAEIEAFLVKPKVELADVCKMAALFTDGKGLLRDQLGMNVTVGRYSPPPGSAHIPKMLNVLLGLLNDGQISPYKVYNEFECIHPFIDGNGRVGRLLWLWRRFTSRSITLINMAIGRGFLHEYHYQALQNHKSVIVAIH